MTTGLAIGIDVGTSGARVLAMDAGFETVARSESRMDAHGTDSRDPFVWRAAVETALSALLSQVDPAAVRAIAVDGTSGTILAVDGAGTPQAAAMMYNDVVQDQAMLDRIAALAPPTSAAHGPTSGLAKALEFSRYDGVRHIIHQADWIAGRFSGRFDVSDENNALKTGYDPVARDWPDWVDRTGLDPGLLPTVLAPGKPVGMIKHEAARTFGLRDDVVIVAGTTDGCASFLATGASEAGEGVTALGSTLTIKLLAEAPIFAPQFGIYSHRIGERWLAGGASNSGGKVLAHYFTPSRIAQLSANIDPDRPSGLDYYPLLGAGERFPFADPAMLPRMDPRPPDDAEFLQGLLEGIGRIEATAYARLHELGGPRLSSVRSVGGGARNPVWTQMRQRLLSVPFLPALSEDAAAGTARLALAGAKEAGLL